MAADRLQAGLKLQQHAAGGCPLSIQLEEFRVIERTGSIAALAEPAIALFRSGCLLPEAADYL